MCDFIEAMKKGLYLDLPEDMVKEENVEVEETFVREEDDFEEDYWNAYFEHQEFLQDVFNSQILTWEEKRANRKFRNNSRFKNKLRDKAGIYHKLFVGNDIDERIVKLGIANIQVTMPFHRLYMSKDYTIQNNAKQWFFGKEVNAGSRTVNGVLIGVYKHNPKGPSSWRKAYAQQEKAKSVEAAKAEIGLGLSLFEMELYDYDDFLDYEDEFYYAYEAESKTSQFAETFFEPKNYWETPVKFKDITDVINDYHYEQKLSSQDYYDSMYDDAYLHANDDFWDRFDDDWEY